MVFNIDRLLSFTMLGKKNITYLFLCLGLGLCLPLISCGEQQGETETEVSPEVAVNSPTEVEGEPVRIGILVIDSAVSVNERYSPLMDYLSEKIGRPFELIPLTQENQFTEVAAGKLDFTHNNPLAAVQIQRLHDIEFLVTVSRPKTGTKFAGLIIVKADSPIKNIADLKGKKAACVDFETAAAGCVFQIFYLRDNGFDPFKDFASFSENPSQDNIVLGVLNETVDVGFIRTGQLERMVSKGLIDNLDGIRILNPKKDDFLYPHTTQLYPEWPFAALENTDPELVEAVKEALLEIPADHPALKAARLKAFVPPADYKKLDKLIQELKLKGWEKSQ